MEMEGGDKATEEKARATLVATLSTKIWQYARRQKAWFKRDKGIKWVEVGSEKKRN